MKMKEVYDNVIEPGITTKQIRYTEKGIDILDKHTISAIFQLFRNSNFVCLSNKLL